VIPLSDQQFHKKIYSAFFENEYPADFIIIVIWLVATIAAIFLPILSETLVWNVLALPAILFIPGYCLTVALFPRRGDISPVERIVFSVGLSVAIFSLIGLVLYFTQGGIPFNTVVLSLIFFTLVLINISFIRRAFLPYDSRFKVSFTAIAGSIRKSIFRTESSWVDYLINMTLVLIILFAVITTVYVMSTPKAGERFSEFYILGENQTASNYPDWIIARQNYPIYIGVVNHEYRNMSYTVETWLVETEFDNMTNTSRIIAMDPNDHLSFTLADNSTMIIPYNLSVKKTGYDRVEFLLFNESVPDLKVTGSDRINASYRDLHLRVTVEDVEYEEPSGEDNYEETAFTS
jgi:uncharacterized membrane protein